MFKALWLFGFEFCGLGGVRLCSCSRYEYRGEVVRIGTSECKDGMLLMPNSNKGNMFNKMQDELSTKRKFDIRRDVNVRTYTQRQQRKSLLLLPLHNLHDRETKYD